MSKPVTAEATSPSDTIGSDEDENETVDESGGWNGKEDEYEDDMSADEAEGEVSESDTEGYEAAEQRNQYLQAGRRPAPAAMGTGNGEHGSRQDDDDDDDERTINGDQEDGDDEEEDEEEEDEDEGDEDEDEDEDEEAMDEDDAQSQYSSSSRSDEDSDDPDKVDPSVAEEMINFEATFRGFSKRFRLVNKIGEGGTLPQRLPGNTNPPRHFLLRLQSRRPPLRQLR